MLIADVLHGMLSHVEDITLAKDVTFDLSKVESELIVDVGLVL